MRTHSNLHVPIWSLYPKRVDTGVGDGLSRASVFDQLAHASAVLEHSIVYTFAYSPSDLEPRTFPAHKFIGAYKHKEVLVVLAFAFIVDIYLPRPTQKRSVVSQCSSSPSIWTAQIDEKETVISMKTPSSANLCFQFQFPPSHFIRLSPSTGSDE
ncbi:uncharacterized protein F5147DRAFT_762034 [Suillus discolor]|uniref:Uncharacterized protein n=1 Tax=Suillus discolor TaxID=1912936 RepID=A0A9P7JSA9_9AGAM|nr:uncharacterized protein F5147DRAFT_762034 [Suillus discolor]KAG2104666.1 hypothetical protein F5147DRAFT_762034 [Suillus discolor]